MTPSDWDAIVTAWSNSKVLTTECGQSFTVLTPDLQFVGLMIFYVFSVLCLLCLCARLFIYALWSPAGKGLTSWISFDVSNC